MPWDSELLIVGAGPSGLASAVFGGSEGIQTILVEQLSTVGGQAGTSALIENYLGILGISGPVLARRATEQVKGFDVDLRTDHRVSSIHQHTPGGFKVEFVGHDPLTTQSLIIAGGVAWRRLDIPYDTSLEDDRIFYGSHPNHVVAGMQIAIVGGGNSAGQLAWKLQRSGAFVTLIVRSEIRESMSDYLLKKLLNQGITIFEHASLTRIGEYEDKSPVARHALEVDVLHKEEFLYRHIFDRLYVCIGGVPQTAFLEPLHLLCDNTGYIITNDHFNPLRRKDNAPLDGVFCVGDIRARSTKRVSVAVGEGAQVIPFVHEFLHKVV